MFQEEGSLTHLRFPQKLWYLLNSRSDAIIWGNFGKTILLNYNVLDRYLRCNISIFKTSRISSFIRQLNLYGFRKVTSHLQDPLCNSSNPDLHEYMHDFFQYGKADLLNNIKRKTWNLRKIKDIGKCSTRYTINRSFGSQRLRLARKSLQEALKRACIQNEDTSFDKENSQNELFRDPYKTTLDEMILPTMWNNRINHNYSTDDYNNKIQETTNNELNKDMNLMTYIENFSVSEHVGNSIEEESFMTSADVSMENRVEYSNAEEQDQPVDYKQYLNHNNYVVVEVVEQKKQKQNQQEEPQYLDWNAYTNEQVEWNNYTSEKQSWNGNILEEQPWNENNCDTSFGEEMILGTTDHLNIKNHHHSTNDEAFHEDNNNTIETYSDCFDETWEYKDILKDVTKKTNPDNEYGVELKELYTQISKTIDLLNS